MNLKLLFSKLRPWLIMFGFIGLYLVVNILLIVGMVAVFGQAVVDQPNTLIIALILTQISTLALTLLLYRKSNLKDYLKLNKVSLKTLAWSFVGGFGTLAAASGIVEIINFINPALVEEYIEAVGSLVNDANVVLVLISVVLLASTVEEVIMRGILFKEFERSNYPSWVVVLASGLLFGVFHLNFVQGAFATVLGIAIALGFLFSRSLYVPILMHLGNNLTSTLIGFLPIAIQESVYLDIFMYSLIVFLPLSLYFIYKENN